MKLTVVGSSDAFNSGGRANACYLLERDAPARRTMIDFGPTALAALKRLGVRAPTIQTIVLTHLHGDHIGGLPYLILDGMYCDVRTGKLEIVGPIGTAQRFDRLMRVTYGDVADRPRPYELVIREVAPHQSIDVDGALLETFPADHMDPPEQPLCLRWTCREGDHGPEVKIAFSGDTALGDGLREAARGVDLLVAECSSLAPPAGRHCTWQQWREAYPLGSKRVLLTHLGPDVRQAIPRLSAEVPGVEFADDGLVVTLPS